MNGKEFASLKRGDLVLFRFSIPAIDAVGIVERTRTSEPATELGYRTMAYVRYNNHTHPVYMSEIIRKLNV
jgi:hypothetical protein